MKSKLKLPNGQNDVSPKLEKSKNKLSGEMGGNDKRITYKHIAIGVTIVGVIGYHLLYKRRPAQQPTLVASMEDAQQTSLVASMEQQAPINPEPTDLELQLLHRDELKALFSGTSSNSFKSRIVNELTRRGYQVIRSLTDPTYLKISTGHIATMKGIRV